MNANSHKASQRPARALRQIFLFLSLYLLGPTLVYAAEPPEVEKLKGLHIFPEGAVRPTSERKVASIPGWKSRGGGFIPGSGRKTDPRLGYGVIKRESLAAFVITRHYPDLSYTVLDARAIPFIHIHDFTDICEREPSPKDAGIVALAYHEECQEETRRIIRAWQVDHRTGQITDISIEGIVCRFPGTGVDNQKCKVVGDSK